MKYNLSLLISLLLCFSSCSSQDKTPTEIEAINVVFKNYTQAIQKGQGHEAIKYISQKTLDYYDSLIYHALYSDEEKLGKINVLTRTAILRMRHTQTVAFWDTMTARKLLQKMWSLQETNPSNAQVNLTDCKTDNFKATCVLQLNGEPTEMKSFFNKENGQWKIDITSITENGIEEMQSDIKRRNISETDYIILILQELENKDASKETLYIPLKKK